MTATNDENTFWWVERVETVQDRRVKCLCDDAPPVASKNPDSAAHYGRVFVRAVCESDTLPFQTIVCEDSYGRRVAPNMVIVTISSDYKTRRRHFFYEPKRWPRSSDEAAEYLDRHRNKGFRMETLHPIFRVYITEQGTP